MEAALALLLIAQQSAMPLAYAERPLTVPADSFELVFELGASQLDTRVPVVFGEAGAKYGHTDDLEIGVRLLRLSMSPAPDTGLNNPMGFLRYRVLSGIFELAGYIESEIPVGGAYEANARVETLLRLGSVARIDLRPEFGVVVENPVRYVAKAPLELSFQIGAHVQVSAVGILEMRDVNRPQNLLGRVGGRLSYTFGGEGRATADLGLLVTTPNLALSGERPPDPAFNNYLLALIDLRWFLGNESTDPWRGFD